MRRENPTCAPPTFFAHAGVNADPKMEDHVARRGDHDDARPLSKHSQHLITTPEMHDYSTERVMKIVTRGVALGERISDAILLREYLRRLSILEQRAGIQVSGVFFDPAELPEANVSELDVARQPLGLSCSLPRAITVNLRLAWEPHALAWQPTETSANPRF